MNAASPAGGGVAGSAPRTDSSPGGAGAYHYVSNTRGQLVRIAVLDNKPRINVGDPVEFLPYSGPRPPDAMVMDMHPDPTPITEDEKNLSQKPGLNENIRTGPLTGKTRDFRSC